MEFVHKSVLLDEVIEGLDIKEMAHMLMEHSEVPGTPVMCVNDLARMADLLV